MSFKLHRAKLQCVIKFMTLLLAGATVALLLTIPAASQADQYPCGANGLTAPPCAITGTSYTTSGVTPTSYDVGVMERWYAFWAPKGTTVTLSIRDDDGACSGLNCTSVIAYMLADPAIQPQPFAIDIGSGYTDPGLTPPPSTGSFTTTTDGVWDVFVGGGRYSAAGPPTVSYTLTATATNGYFQWPPPGTTPTSTPNPTPTPSPKPKCSEVAFIGAAGSGEQSNGHDPMGREVDRMAATLRAHLNARGKSMAILPDPYPAESTDDLFPSKIEAKLFAVSAPLAFADYAYNVHKYMQSIATGVGDAVSLAEQEVSACPGIKLVMAGYSQGAIAMHQAELRLPRNVLSHVAGTLLLGDGDRVPYTRAKPFGYPTQFGKPLPSAEGVRVALHQVSKRDVALPATTAEICSAGDIVCDWSVSHVLHAGLATRVHTTYPNSLLDSAATWLAGRIH